MCAIPIMFQSTQKLAEPFTHDICRHLYAQCFYGTLQYWKYFTHKQTPTEDSWKPASMSKCTFTMISMLSTWQTCMLVGAMCKWAVLNYSCHILICICHILVYRPPGHVTQTCENSCWEKSEEGEGGRRREQGLEVRNQAMMKWKEVR